MKNYLLILIIPFFYCCKANGQETDNARIKETANLFQKIEDDMQNHYNYLDKKKLFEDPLGRIAYFFKAVKKFAPQLLSDTKS